MFFAEDKPVGEISKILNLPEDVAKKTQEFFPEQIEIAKKLHMKTILDMMAKYHANLSESIKLTNIKIQEFLRKYIPKDEKPA